MRLVPFLAGLLCAVASTAAVAQPWPTRPITMVVGFAPGGSTDVVARLLQRKLSEKLGTPIVVENRPGGSGIIAQTMVAQAKPDGYTLLFGSGSIASNANLKKKLPFDTLNDFVPVTQVTTIPAIVCVNDALPVTSLAELIAYVKANPGKVHYGSAGTGTLQHVAGALFEKLIGGTMVHVPYRGGASANMDLLANRVQLVFGPVVELQQYVQSGKVRVLGVTSPDKTSAYPGAMPVSALVPTYEISTWHGVFAPKGTPRATVDTVQRGIAEVLAQPEVQSRLTELGLEVVGSTPDGFREFVVRDIRRWGDLVALAGIEPE